MTSLSLKLWWESRDTQQEDDARDFARFVNRLPEFDSIYESWLESPDTQEKVIPVPLDLAGARNVLAENVECYDDGTPWPELGSDVWAGHAGPKPYDFRQSSYADTRCSIGNFGRHASATPNSVFMRLSEVRPSTGRPWRASELRPLMKFAREVWRPAEMLAMSSFEMDYFPKIADPAWAAGIRMLSPWVGWITYLPPDLAARARYPCDVEVETLDDGAALVTLCEDRLQPSDFAGIARLKALQAALRPIQS